MIERILSGVLCLALLALAGFAAWLAYEDMNSSVFILAALIAWLAWGLGSRAVKG